MITVLMQCLGCGVMVKNPRAMNYMYEKCNVCLKAQMEKEEKAIDSYLSGQAEKELKNNG